MRSLNHPTRTILSSFVGMGLLAACSSDSGAGTDAGLPTVAAVIYDSATPAAMLGVPSTRPLPAPVTPPLLIISAPPKSLTPPPPTVPPVVITPPVAKPPPGGVVPPPPGLPVDTGAGAITDVHIASTATTAQSAVPVTFGQVFAVGDLSPSRTLAGKLADGSSVPMQVDVKARHADGSVRHAVVSTVLPKLAPGQVQRIVLHKVAPGAAGTAATPASLLNQGFTTTVQVELDGVRYQASADSLLRAGKATPWLSGPVVTEWLLSAPLTRADGKSHPHLTARFAVRAYTGVKAARVDVILENNWAFEPNPRTFTYNANVQISGRTVYTKSSLQHFHHARWRKTFWWGNEPATHISHNVGYLIGTRALPNYDRSIDFAHAELDAMKTKFAGTRAEPMGIGLAQPYMPSTGGRGDIGLLPEWAATYLLTMDKRAKDVTLGTADLAGSWSIHYRDKATDRPVSLHDYPYMTLLGQENDTFNPATRKKEAFPACPKTICTSPYAPDSSHQPAFSFLPYLVTGDHYHLEELQFWGLYNVFRSNPSYRQQTKGLVKPEQVRGQAWSLRTLGEAAYATPEGDPLKPVLNAVVKSNLAWYNEQYTHNADANKLGALTHGYAIVYDDKTGLAPWMDDFFTSAVGHLVEMGYSDALPLLKWKVKFPTERMVGSGACWVTGAMYNMRVRDTKDSELYTTIGKAWKASSPAKVAGAACGSQVMATLLGMKVGEMTGYSRSATGFPSNMQPALAYAADVGGNAGAAAWSRFSDRSVKPDYGKGPQFAIVPRQPR